MRYTIRHVTRFSYESPVREAVMEARMQPRTDMAQRCLHFTLRTEPASRVMTYQDHENNTVHHFNIPGQHVELAVMAEALVESMPARALPHRLGPDGWRRVDELAGSGQWWEYLAPSTYVRQPEPLLAFAREVALERGNDPLVTLRRLMGELHVRLAYSPNSTRVDSPIDEILEKRRGVCQDFVHVFLSLVRHLGVPARYVSGYVHHDAGDFNVAPDGATHAWVEVLLPELGWVGLDPTNNRMVDDRHVRVAIGRDYADVPPTRGVFKGSATVHSELEVSVDVGPAPSLTSTEVVPFTPWLSRGMRESPAPDRGGWLPRPATPH